MDEQRKKIIITKVSKLLAKAHRTTFQAEAQAFLAKAQEVLAEHGLSMAEIDALSAQEQRDLVTESDPYFTDTATKVPDWMADLSVVIARNFRCRVYFGHKLDKKTYRNRRTIVFMGMGTDTQIAGDVFASAVSVADRLSKAYIKEVDEVTRSTMETRLGIWQRRSWDESGQRADKAKVSKHLRIAWLGGFVAGLRERFEEQKKAMPGMALVLVVHPLVNERYKEEVTGKAQKRTTVHYGSAAARSAGFEAGKQFTPTPGTGVSGRISSPRP